LLFWPPRTVPAAIWRLIIGLTAMFVLAPATRFGYFVYPVGLLVWLEVSRMGLAAGAGGARAGTAGDEAVADGADRAGAAGGAARARPAARNASW